MSAAAPAGPPVAGDVRDAVDRQLAEILEGLPAPAAAEIKAGLIQSFLTDAADQVRAISQLAARADLPGVALEAHSLKGAAATIGVEVLAALAAQLETNARPGGLVSGSSLHHRVEALQRAYREVERQLRPATVGAPRVEPRGRARG